MNDEVYGYDVVLDMLDIQCVLDAKVAYKKIREALTPYKYMRGVSLDLDAIVAYMRKKGFPDYA